MVTMHNQRIKSPKQMRMVNKKKTEKKMKRPRSSGVDRDRLEDGSVTQQSAK